MLFLLYYLGFGFLISFLCTVSGACDGGDECNDTTNIFFFFPPLSKALFEKRTDAFCSELALFRNVEVDSNDGPRAYTVKLYYYVV